MNSNLYITIATLAFAKAASLPSSTNGTEPKVEWEDVCDGQYIVIPLNRDWETHALQCE